MSNPPNEVDYEALLDIGQQLLTAVGANLEDPSLKDTPRRYANFWREFIEYDPGKIDTSFAETRSGKMIIVSGMRIWSLCEHHLLPFWADVSIAYIPKGNVLGLSKFARIAHQYAHQLQIQERLVSQIADDVTKLTKTNSVAVMATGVHTCMVMRGIKTDGRMTTLDTRGAFEDEPHLCERFLLLADK